MSVLALENQFLPLFKSSGEREQAPGAAIHIHELASLTACRLLCFVSSTSKSAVVPSPITAHFSLLHSFPLDPQSFALVGQFASTPRPNRIGFRFRPHLFIVDFARRCPRSPPNIARVAGIIGTSG